MRTQETMVQEDSVGLEPEAMALKPIPFPLHIPGNHVLTSYRGGRSRSRRMALTVQVQMSPGCGHGQKTVELVRRVVDEVAPEARIEAVTVATLDDAERLGFRGSPTVLVDGTDIEPGPPGGGGLG